MSVDTAPPATASAVAKPARKAAAPKPAKLTVPAKPAAVTAGNLGTLATTAVVVGGPPAWIALAGGAAVTGTVLAARAYRRSSAVRRASSGWAMTWPSVGRSGKSFPVGGGRPRSGTALRSPLVGRSVGGSTGRHAAGGARGGAGGARPGGGRPGAAGSSTPKVTSAPATRAGRIARRVVQRTAKVAKPVGRATWRAAKATGRVARKAAVRAWKWGRTIVRRSLGRTDPAEPAKATTPKATPARPATGSTVNRPAGTTKQTTTTRGGTDPMAKAAPKAPPAGGPLFQSARRFHADCSAHTVKGTMEHYAEAYDFSYAINELAAGIQARVAHCGQDGVDPAYQQALAAIANMVTVAATSAKRLGPAFYDLHRDKIQRITHPLPGEAKWDTVNNARP